MAIQLIGNRYAVSKLIGEGGMADVYLAVDTILKRQVALKVLRGKLNSDPVNIKRFQREAEAITNLSHPNIVEVYDVGEEQQRNYIVMEYVPGKTLKQLIRARGALNPGEAINIMKQLVSATAHAHHNGIIHRDIKSQNVLIKDDGTVKLSDFGIAQTDDSQQLTQTNSVMGSVHYLAPELARGKPATFQSDIYSLGIVFYEMLTGNVPFRGENAVEIALKHLHDPMPGVRNFNPDLPQSLENIIIRSTAKNKDSRYKSADDMYDDLVTCLDISRIKETKLILAEKKPAPKEEVKQPAKQVKRRKNRLRLSTVFACLATLALCGAIIYILMVLNGQLINKSSGMIVPDVSGMTLSSASELLESEGYLIEEVVREATEDTDKDIVLKTDPVAGSEINGDVSIVIYVSSGKIFTIGNYINQNINSVKGVLEAQGFTVTVNYVQSSSLEAGTIMEQSIESGTTINPTDTKAITLTVSEEVTFQIPASIIGMDYNEAKETLEELGASVTLQQLSAEDNIDPETGEYINEIGVVISCTPEVNSFYTQTTGGSIILYYY